MEEVEKLELMIKNESTYEEIIEQSKKIDEYIKNKIEEALQPPHNWFMSKLVFE